MRNVSQSELLKSGPIVKIFSTCRPMQSRLCLGARGMAADGGVFVPAEIVK